MLLKEDKENAFNGKQEDSVREETSAVSGAPNGHLSSTGIHQPQIPLRLRGLGLGSLEGMHEDIQNSSPRGLALGQRRFFMIDRMTSLVWACKAILSQHSTRGK